jgi:CBS domain containing-hemolysin-like protein
MWLLTLLLGVLVVLLITAVTGYFVAQEFAYMAVDRARLGSLAERGDARAKRALSVTRRTSFMLSGAQLGITVTGLLVGYVAEPLIGESIGTALGGVDVPTGVGVAIGTVLALLFSTFVQMVFGELFPKNLAIARPEPVSLWLAWSTTGYLALFGWLIRLFDAASNALLRVLRIEPVHDVQHAATPRDLEHIVEQSGRSGDLPPELTLLLDRILDFPSSDVEHAMIPRSRVDVLRPDDDLVEVRAVMALGHSRYPVLSEDDEVLGVVQLVDVLATEQEPTADGTVGELVRPALILPTTMTLPVALRQLTNSTNQLACVVDEYGGFAGVLTVEDMAEELIGEITDEHDPDDPTAEPRGDDGTWVMGGDVHIDEVERAVGHELPVGDYETIAGLVIAHHGSLPDVGSSIEVDLPVDLATLADSQRPARTRMRVEVLEIDRHVPALVRVTCPIDPSDQNEETVR